MKKLLVILLSIYTLACGATVEQLSTFSNAIDNVLQKQYTQVNVTPLPRINDDAFVRRAYLNIIGRNPTLEEYEMFNKATGDNKGGPFKRQLDCL